MNIAKSTHIAGNATVIGDVTLGEHVSIWYGAVLRADRGVIRIGDGSNIQDNAVVHMGDGYDTLVGKCVSVGHGAILHGCTIGDGTVVGMGAIVMNGAVVGKECIIGAGALVTQGKVIPDRSIVLGNPGKVVRTVTDEEAASNLKNASLYEKEAESLPFIAHVRNEDIPRQNGQ